jgi:hypothetical protein
MLSVWPKLRDFTQFEPAFIAYRLTPERFSRPLALAFVASEAAAALLLTLAPLQPLGALLGSAVVALATGAVVINLVRGRREIRCGCGSAAESMPLSLGLVGRNLALLMILGLAAWSAIDGTQRQLGILDFAAAAFSAFAMLLMWLLATQLLVNAGRTNGSASNRLRTFS